MFYDHPPIMRATLFSSVMKQNLQHGIKNLSCADSQNENIYFFYEMSSSHKCVFVLQYTPLRKNIHSWNDKAFTSVKLIRS